MKKISLSVLSILCVASMNVSAMQMDGAKLISHKVWGADNIKLSFKEGQLDQNKVKMLKAVNAKDKTPEQIVAAGTKITSVEVLPVGEISTLKTDNWSFIFNETSEPQMYTVKHEICPLKVRGWSGIFNLHGAAVLH